MLVDPTVSSSSIISLSSSSSDSKSVSWPDYPFEAIIHELWVFFSLSLESTHRERLMSTAGLALVVIVTFLLLPQGFGCSPSSVHPLIQNAPIPQEQYLLLAEKKVTCSIISKRTFDLTFTEEAENSCRCEDAAGLV